MHVHQGRETPKKGYKCRVNCVHKLEFRVDQYAHTIDNLLLSLNNLADVLMVVSLEWYRLVSLIILSLALGL
jgi:hypothetical protein